MRLLKTIQTMKLFNIALSLLALIGVVACNPMSEYQDELDNRKTSDDAYKIHISTRSQIFESDYAEQAYTLTAEDYDRCDATAPYDNFSIYSPIEEYMPEVMDAYYANAGEVIPLIYSFYDGDTTTHDNSAFVTFIKDSLAWTVVPNFLMIETANETFDHKYTLTDEDYKVTLGFGYANFDLRYESREDIVDGLNTVLKTNMLLELKEGDIWQMNFNTYGTPDNGAVIESPLYLEVTIIE